jgi:diguanylate cyclase (GGDEF)-like protein
MSRRGAPAIALLALLAASLAPAAAGAACLAAGSGDLAALEQFAFVDPSLATRQAASLLGAPAAAPGTARRATLLAVLAESQRQTGHNAEAIAAAEQGKADAAAAGSAAPADLRLRLDIALALALHADHQTRRALDHLDELLAAQAPGSAGVACILKDRGWVRFTDGNTEGALRDLILAYEQLRQRGQADEQTIAAGRLAAVYVGAREYDQAVDLLNESIRYFSAAGAVGRLPTAYDRLGRALTEQAKYADALDAFEKMGREAKRVHDNAALAYSNVRVCGVEIERRLYGAAALRCRAARSVLAATPEFDREEKSILDAYEARIALAAGHAQAALDGFDRALDSDPGALSKHMQSLFHLWRADAYAALGRHAEAFAESQEYLARLQALNETEAARQVAVLRVRFATDREIRKNEILERDNALKQERLARQQLATRLWIVVAGIATLLILVLAWALLSNRRHRRDLQQLAEMDDLTHLPNRRQIIALAAREFDAARQRRQPLTVALIDVDHFKLFNDRFGHASGDAVLGLFSREAERSVGASGCLGRYGGEEFLLVLPGLALESARPVVERVREAARALQLPGELADARITISAGIAALQVDDATVEVLIRRADAALYTAKNAGRDRISAIVA